MHSAEEPNSFFGGMAAPEWNSEGKYAEDPANECSWLFKLEAGEDTLLFIHYNKRVDVHCWECIDRKYAICCDKSLFF